MIRSVLGTYRVTRRTTLMLVVVGVVSILIFAPAFFLTTGYRLDVAKFAFYLAALTATWSVLAGIAGQFSFAHASLAGLAGYVAAIWTREFASVPAVGSVFVGMAAGILFAWTLGSLLGLLLSRLRGAYLALFTIAFAEVAKLVVVAESEITGGRLSLAVRPLPGSSLAHYYVLLALLIGLLGLVYWIMRTRVGLFLRAMREDYQAASALGVDVGRLKLLVLSFAALAGSLAGSVYFSTISRLAPENLDLFVMFQVIAFAVIGGIESPLAGAAAALLMYSLLESLRGISLEPVTVVSIAGVVAITSLVAFRRGIAHLGAIGDAIWWQVGLGASALGAGAGLVWLATAPVRSQLSTSPALLVLAVGSVVMFALMLSRVRRRGAKVRTSSLMGAGAGLAVAAMLFQADQGIHFEPGVWRLALFGGLFMLTLRFRPNGLIAPLLAVPLRPSMRPAVESDEDDDVTR